MIEHIQKRDGRVVDFEVDKIAQAILKAARSVGGDDTELAYALAREVVCVCEDKAYEGEIPAVEDVQDCVEKVLIENGHARTAKAYILYRDKRSRIREKKSELMEIVSDILVETSRENANINNSPSAKMLQIAMAASKQYYLTNLLPEDLATAHRRGDIHIHDLDYYSKTLNCLQIDLDRLFSEGFNTGYGFIRPPQRVSSAAAQAAIILQSNQNDMFGGQSFPHFDKSMATLIRHMPHTAQYIKFDEGDDLSKNELYQAMEALIYNLNTMHSRAGAQVPFSSINIGTDVTPEGRAVIRSILMAFDKGLGRNESPIFPNLVFRVKAGVNMHPEDPNYDLFQLAIKVASHRMNPTFSFMDASFNKEYGDEVSYMGCRTRTIGNRHGQEVSAGRGNIAPVTINLPRIALRTRNVHGFFEVLSDVMQISIRQLLHRFEILSELKVNDLPFLMGQHLYMGSEALKHDQTIREVILNGTLGIGFIGLAEALQVLVGEHHGQSVVAQDLGLHIVQTLKQKCDEFADYYNLNVVLYATPAEGTAGRYVKLDLEEFGIIPGVTDGGYYTNSFHVPVSHQISFIDKLKIEGQYHKFCNGGHISYVELDAPPVDNPQAVEKIILSMAKSDIGYAGLNFPIDSCVSCGYTGVISVDTCPQCGGGHIRRIRRITGYLSTVDRFNAAKLAELASRVTHV